MSLATKLQKLRTAKGQSLQVVADAVGASKAHIWELEKGTAANPSIELLRGIAEHFGVSIASLVGEDPNDAQDEKLVVMYRDLQNLDDNDRQFIELMLESMKKKRDLGQ